MQPDDIPTEITKLVYTAPWIMPRSQNDIAELLAHYWPAIEQHVRAQSIPAWEVVYEPGNVSDYLIGYTNDEAPAKAAAEAWFRSQYLDEVGSLAWVDQLHGKDFTAWFDLIHVAPDGDKTGPGITVRCRAEGAGQ